MVTCGETGLPVFACLSVYDCADIARICGNKRFSELIDLDGTLQMARCILILTSSGISSYLRVLRNPEFARILWTRKLFWLKCPWKYSCFDEEQNGIEKNRSYTFFTSFFHDTEYVNNLNFKKFRFSFSCFPFSGSPHPWIRKQNKMSENTHESKVEMVISNLPKPVLTSVFWTFYSASVIHCAHTVRIGAERRPIKKKLFWTFGSK